MPSFPFHRSKQERRQTGHRTHVWSHISHERVLNKDSFKGTGCWKYEVQWRRTIVLCDDLVWYLLSWKSQWHISYHVSFVLKFGIDKIIKCLNVFVVVFFLIQNCCITIRKQVRSESVTVFYVSIFLIHNCTVTKWVNVRVNKCQVLIQKANNK